jgi:hypothetical protein
VEWTRAHRNTRLADIPERIVEEPFELSLGVSRRRHRGSIDYSSAFAPGPDEATGLQDAEVIGDGLARHIKPLLQLSRTHIPSVKQLQYAQPRIRGERPDNLDNVFHSRVTKKPAQSKRALPYTC